MGQEGNPGGDAARARPGSPRPLGATWDGSGINVAIHARGATDVDLCLFADPGDPLESRCVRLPERTGHVWHGYLPGIEPGQAYGFRVHGPWDPDHGLRYNPAKLLLDPYGRAVVGGVDWAGPVYGHRTDPRVNDLLLDDRDSAPFVPRSVVIDPAFDWGDDRPPATPLHRSLIYEIHTRGFTKLHPGVPPELRGTFAGLAHPAAIAHLLDFGITAVELLPVHAWVDEAFLSGLGLTNYWGYNSIAFFAPAPHLAAANDPQAQVREFKQMVKHLHAAGLEVLLDVVYNHTAEGNHLGPMLSFRGIDNPGYYRLVPEAPRYYVDVTGTGNTVNTRYPPTLAMVMDSLRYWVQEMHVDGFRFDLAPALAREQYDVDPLGSFLDAVHQDPVLGGVKLIAEPWDVGAGGYQLGRFPVGWSEWNDRYRNTVRSFWRGDGGQIADLASRLTGSSDLFRGDGRGPDASINYVTAHDGFTLRDLVSYERKHNEANGEHNRDGAEDNRSANYGVEGPTLRPDVLALRARQQRNLMATLILSQGVPMLLGGDEIGRTQKGNNNAYCQDNEVSWVDWSLVPSDRSLLAFAKKLVALRHAHPVLRRRTFLEGFNGDGQRDLAWLRAGGGEMTDADWSDPDCRALGLVLLGDALRDLAPDGTPLHDETLAILLNAGLSGATFDLPPADPAHPDRWEVLLDTGAPASPPRGVAPNSCTVPPRTLLLLRRLPAA